MRKKVLGLSITFNIVLLSICVIIFLNLGGFSRFVSAQPVSYADGRTATFSKLKVTEDNIVFIGDSITEGGEWSEFFNDPYILNRGINGDTTEGVLNRIDNILAGHPRKMFILIGINDLAHKVNSDEIEKNYKGIIEKVKNLSPNTEVYVQSILPNNSSIGSKEVPSSEIIYFNKRLKIMAKDYDVIYIDLFSAFETEETLNNDLTYDGLHLNAEGYSLWVSEIKDMLK